MIPIEKDLQVYGLKLLFTVFSGGSDRAVHDM